MSHIGRGCFAGRGKKEENKSFLRDAHSFRPVLLLKVLSLWKRRKESQRCYLYFFILLYTMANFFHYHLHFTLLLRVKRLAKWRRKSSYILFCLTNGNNSQLFSQSMLQRYVKWFNGAWLPIPILLHKNKHSTFCGFNTEKWTTLTV